MSYWVPICWTMLSWLKIELVRKVSQLNSTHGKIKEIGHFVSSTEGGLKWHAQTVQQHTYVNIFQSLKGSRKLFTCQRKVHPVKSQLLYLVTDNSWFTGGTTVRKMRVNSFYIPHTGNSGEKKSGAGGGNKACFHIQDIMMIKPFIYFKTESEDATYQFVIWNMHPVFCSDEFVSTV